MLGRPYRELARPMRRVGALIDPRARHPGRTAYAHLLALAQSNDLPRQRVDEVIELVGIESVAHERVRGFSLGMGQRLGIAGGAARRPRRPRCSTSRSTGWTPRASAGSASCCATSPTRAATVLVSSHLMSEMEDTADHLVVLGRGRLLADLPMADLLGAHSAVRVRTPMAPLLARALDGPARGSTS